MKTLYAFGCSYTYGDETSMYYNNPYQPSLDAWPNLLSEKLNLTCVNLGKSGASNDYIFRSVLSNIKNFDHDDKIFIMMTFPDRRLIRNNDDIVNAFPANEKYKEYYLKYHSEELGILNFIQNLLSLQMILQNYYYYITFTTYEPILLCKKYQWSKNFTIDKTKTIKPPGLGFYSLVDAKKRKHPDDNGHRTISDLIYNFIEK